MKLKPIIFETIYEEVKADIVSGVFSNGEPIEIRRFEERLDVSPTPIRMVLNRLAGENLVVSLPHRGFRMPWITENTLRDLYDWNLMLLKVSLQIADTNLHGGDLSSITDLAKHNLVEATEKLFALLAGLSNNAELIRAMSNANDRLHWVRVLKASLIVDRDVEFSQIIHALNFGDAKALKRILEHYHFRRRQIVSKTVILLNR
jgi:DNA-binding GntR family transcriptional regulator